jgi:hypothetical protein
MLMNAVLAVALGLAPMKAGQNVQVIHYNPSDYTGLIGRYSQSTDRRGVTHLSGFDRLSGKPFDIAVAQDGQVEGTVGDMYVTFHVSEGA